MRIGYTGWTWDTDERRDWAPFNEFHKENFEQFLREVSNLGYETVENFSFIADYYAGDVEGFKKTVASFGLKFENLYFYFSNDAEKDYEDAKKYIAFAREVGATHMNMQGVMWKDRPFVKPTDKDAILDYAKRSNIIGEWCTQAGIKACMHPHANTRIFQEDQIEMFVENTDPRYVYLCLDTAHLTLAGMSAPEIAKKFGKRVGYVHLKDIDPNENAHPEWPMRRFLPLGYGCVDFKGFVNSLKEEGYDGILCVELDYQPVCNYKSAMDSRNYLRNVLGL
ncbi:MAG TPA: sugar phosphate isomerase/epimerase family protein [Clostridia bacterium]|nr:sugar phosphate isomerase/epimerase family protein [Clostridia bacterium]